MVGIGPQSHGQVDELACRARLGWAAVALMGGAAIGMFYFMFKGA